MATSTGRIWTLILLSVAVFGPGEAMAQMLRPARTVYELKLNQDRESPGIDRAKGRLIMELIESCGGFIFNQAFITDITSSEGPHLVGDMQASAWESRDGRSIRFNLLNRINGKIIEREQGRGNLDAQGAGQGTWRLPKVRELNLPKGTMFPISHNRALLEHAISGSRGFEVSLFDGSNDAGYYRASVFIGNRSDHGKDAGNKLLSDELLSWPIRLAYYHYDNVISEPEFEVGFTMYSNGVVDKLSLDYPEFGLTGHLIELEYLEKPECD